MTQATRKKKQHKVNAAGGENPLGDIKTAIAVCSFALNAATNEVQLTPAGHFKAVDGRPFDAKDWYIDGVIAARIIANAEARITPFIIDYEHQTLLSEKNGQPAPAAARFSTLEWRDGQGLFATDVKWTEKAAAFIKSGEYGFISPVLPYQKGTGEVRGFLHAALTNTPAVDGMHEVAALAAKNITTSQEDHIMDRELLIAMLNLSAEASDADIKSAITALKQQADASTTQAATIAALKQTQFDPAQHIDLATFEAVKTELATLKQEGLNHEIESLVTAGLKDGRLTANQDAWARKLGASDIAALKQYLDDANPIEALKGSQTGGKKPEGGDGDTTLDADALAVCKQLGIDPKEYLKTQNEEA